MEQVGGGGGNIGHGEGEGKEEGLEGILKIKLSSCGGNVNSCCSPYRFVYVRRNGEKKIFLLTK